jgi:nicotinate phosphoribosyltransferase
MINRLSSFPFFKGTSNMEFAMKYNLPVIGTHAHELFMVMESIVHPKDSQRFALDMWLREYKGNLAVALTDIFGIDTFIKDCDSHLLRAYNGFRHDSGDPYEFAKKIIQLLKNHNINPMEKMIIWSDGLTIQRALNLTKTFNKEIKTMCGIGTHLSNDNNAEPLNMVIKITKANGLDVCKLSDSPGKIMCENQTYIDYLKQIFNIGI